MIPEMSNLIYFYSVLEYVTYLHLRYLLLYIPYLYIIGHNTKVFLLENDCYSKLITKKELNDIFEERRLRLIIAHYDNHNVLLLVLFNVV